MPFYARILAALLLLLFAFALSDIARSRSDIEKFRSDTLRNAAVSETVLVRGVLYEVREGGVFRGSEPVRGLARFEALRIAYAATLARRSPVFGLAGTDPALLRESLGSLSKVARDISLVQSSPRERRDIARHLYPLRFLNALARAEEARKVFLEAPSAAHMRRYERTVKVAVAEYQRDIRAFRAAFEFHVRRPEALAVVGGAITKESFLAALEEAARRAVGLERALRERSKCFSRDPASCRVADLDYPRPQDLPERNNASLSHAREVVSVLSEAHPPDIVFTNGKMLVALRGSSCAKPYEEPHYFLMPSIETAHERKIVESLVFVGELLSYPGEGPREFPFAFFSPTTFYLCPSVASDLSRAVSTQRAYALLGSLHEYEYGTGKHLDERRARAIVREPQGGRETEEIALSFADHGAGLDMLIRDIVAQQRAILRQIENGFARDMTAEWNFLVRSGAASLFLFHHRTLAPAIDLRAPSAADATDSLVRWSPGEGRAARERVIESIRAFLELHGD